MAQKQQFRRPLRKPTLSELEPLVRGVLARYGLGNGRLENLRYYNNATYAVSLGSTPSYVLRVTNNHYSAAELESELEWLNAIGEDAHFRIPSPVPTLEGRLTTTLESGGEPRRCALFRWLTGTHRPEASLEPEDLSNLGKATAALRARSAAFVPKPAFQRPTLDGRAFLSPGPEGLYERILAHWRAHLSAKNVARLEQLTHDYRASLQSPPHATEYGLVHGDFHAGNYLFAGSSIAFIDFEDLGWGSFAYDAATALFGLRDRDNYPELLDRYLDGQTRILPLSAGYGERLEQLQALRAAFLTSLAVTRNDEAEHAFWQRYVLPKLKRLTER